MIKRIFILLSLVLISFFSFDITFSACNYNGGDVMGSLENCIGDGETDLVKTGDDLKVDGGFKVKIMEWITKIATFLALGAIFSIVFGSFKMVLSAGEEEGVKKAKDIIKWGIIGLLAVVSAGFIVSVVVKLIYSVGSI
ncbi:MAG: hypothetical protein Q9M94_05845 [Candidatus Gracilibacteria bacterium]|nr:hypothetical protein [Candidatus Gracilibacteria bacterium]MDQ7022616.1 hypothetical protein [Candidatus Gracilibacteria bacterium]